MAPLPVTSHAYTLDNEGDRTALSEFITGITPTGQSDSLTMSYDGLLRLTGVSVTSPESFALDGASNLTSRTGPRRRSVTTWRTGSPATAPAPTPGAPPTASARAAPTPSPTTRSTG